MKKLMLVFLFSSACMLPGANLFAQCCDYTYQQQVEPPTSAATFGVALADFDGDGDRDAVAISAYLGVDVYFNNGSGTFTLNAQYDTLNTNADFYGVHACNVDGDADIDIIAIPFYSSASLTILKNNGSGVFTVSSVSSNIATYNASVGDIDGDNDIDVFLPNSGGGAGKIFKNDGTGTFSLFQTLTGARGHDAALGDLDGDGDLDAFVTENGSYANSVFRNNGSGTFTQIGTNFGTEGGAVDLGDLDGDGDPDAWVGGSSHTSTIWLNDGTGNFTSGAVISTDPTWGYCKTVILYDMDDDNDPDVFLGFYSHEPQVWENEGGLNFSICYEATVGSGSHGQAIGFINNDTLIDIYSGLFSNTDGDYVFLNAGETMADIKYNSSPYCPYLNTPQSVTQSGAPGGTYSASPAGLSINPATGAILPNASIPGVYTVTYFVGGCEFTTQVEINSLDLTTTVTDPIITSNQTGGTYQWVDCNNSYQPIPGATLQSYTAPANGSYAVIVTYDGCTDTSSCANIVTVGVPGYADEKTISVYPNPAGDQITVQTRSSFTNQPYSIFDASGKILLTGILSSEVTRIDVSELPSGVYLLKAGDNLQSPFKVIKH
jgi:hypothetical protein